MRINASVLIMVLVGFGAMNLAVQPALAGTVTNGFDTDVIYVLRGGSVESEVRMLDETKLDNPPNNPPDVYNMDLGAFGTLADDTFPKAIKTPYRAYPNGADASRIKSLCFSNSPVAGQNSPAGARLFGVYEVKQCEGPLGPEPPAEEHDPPAWDWTNYGASFQIVELNSAGKRIRVMKVGLAASQFYDISTRYPAFAPGDANNNHSPDMLIAPWGLNDMWGEFTRHNFNGGARNGNIRYNPVKNTLMVACNVGEFDIGVQTHPLTGEGAYPRGRIYEFALPDWPEQYYTDESQLPYWCTNKTAMLGEPIPVDDPALVRLVQIYEMPFPHSVSANNGQIREINARPAIDIDSDGNVYFTSKFFNATTPPNWGSTSLGTVWNGDGLYHGDVVKCSTKGRIGGREIYRIPITGADAGNLVIREQNQGALGHGSYAGGHGLAVRGDDLITCSRNGNLNQHCNGPGTDPPDYWVHIFDLTTTEGGGYPYELGFIKVLDNYRCDWPRAGSRFIQTDSVSGRVYVSNNMGACDCVQNFMCIQTDDAVVGDVGYTLNVTDPDGTSSGPLNDTWDAASPPVTPVTEPTGACCKPGGCQDGVLLSACDPRYWLGAGTTCTEYGGQCPVVCNEISVDEDGDLDVDQDDFAIFQLCYSGDGTPYPSDPDNCKCFDLGSDDPDGDGDIDHLDFDVFENCASGPDVPATVGCDN